ncbi:hypothetical protein [Bacillus infantis]|nr:hypothetical protein [Bacillus infantis]
MTQVEARTLEITKDDVDNLLELMDQHLDSELKRMNYEVLLKIL